MTKEELEELKHELDTYGGGIGTSDALRLIAEIERLQSEREWQRIETAPKDGTRILVFGSLMDRDTPFTKPPPPESYEAAWWKAWYSSPNPGWMIANCDEEYGDYIDATHWMPLPDAPEGGKE